MQTAKHLGSSKIRSLNSTLLGKIHALLQDVLYMLQYSNESMQTNIFIGKND